MDLIGLIIQYVSTIIVSLVMIIAAPFFVLLDYFRRRMLGCKMFRSILITGASKGIGRSLAVEFAKKPYRKSLFLIARDLDALNEVRSACLEYPDTDVHIYSVDVTDRGQMKKIIDEIDKINPLDLVIANAGVTMYTNRSTATVTDTVTDVVDGGMTYDPVYKLFDINLYGVLNTIFPAIETMKLRNLSSDDDTTTKTIVVMSSHAANLPLPGPSAFYSASKAALLFLQGYRSVLREDSIDLAIVQPGYVQTQMTERVDDFPLIRNFVIDLDVCCAQIISELEVNKLNISFPRSGTILTRLGSLIPEEIRDLIWSIAPNLILGERMSYERTERQ